MHTHRFPSIDLRASPTGVYTPAMETPLTAAERRAVRLACLSLIVVGALGTALVGLGVLTLDTNGPTVAFPVAVLGGVYGLGKLAPRRVSRLRKSTCARRPPRV